MRDLRELRRIQHGTRVGGVPRGRGPPSTVKVACAFLMLFALARIVVGPVTPWRSVGVTMCSVGSCEAGMVRRVNTFFRSPAT